MRITGLALDAGVGAIRLTAPLTVLAYRGHKCKVLPAVYGKSYNSGEIAGDILILQRQNSQMYFDLVAKIPKGCRPKIVYEVDDLLWDDPYPKQGQRVADDLDRTVPPMMRRCEAVICSTPELSGRAKEFNDRVYTVPNGIDFGLRDWSKHLKRPVEWEGKIIIGWSGSGWHEGDLDVMGKSLRKVLLDNPRSMVLLQGDVPNLAQWVTKLDLPRKKVAFMEWMSFGEHPSVYSLFDIGLAPLAKTPYNQCKSELKLLELGAWGLPFVATDIAPYRRFRCLADDKPGFLCRNEGEWYNYLSALVKSEELRLSQGASALGCVMDHYTLEMQADALEKALMEVHNGP